MLWGNSSVVVAVAVVAVLARPFLDNLLESSSSLVIYYERDILYPLATERITIDLDDGVLVNYNKFGEAIKLVKGLNDKKAKDKVKGFDWIDSRAII